MAADVTVPNDFVQGVNSDADAVDANFASLVTWINTNAVHLDGTKAFTGIVTGPNSDPVAGNDFARKSYVDTMFANAVPQTSFKEVKLRRVANQSLTAPATTAITWDTEDADVSGFITVSSTTLTVPSGADGLYAITMTAISATSLTYNVIPRINGVDLTTGYAKVDSTASSEAKVGFVVWLRATDTVICRVNNTGVTANFTASMQMTRLSD